jgi:S-adenosylmethionine synthetase
VTEEVSTQKASGKVEAISAAAHGEDVKIMAVRHDAAVSLTVARAFVASHVPSLGDYLDEKRS